VRFLRLIRQARWISPEWLPVGELQGDALLDLQTKDNALSVWEVRSDADEERVAVALAASRDNVDVLDYAVFDDSEFPSIGITLGKQDGATPDMAVNQLHYELDNLTVSKIAQLAQVLSRVKPVRIPRKQVIFRLKEAVSTGTLNKETVKPGLLEALR
jgi:hypothetical protein